ncbi:archease [Desulfomonile tiedjei]|nr:archease [Desulfomonile tiedjei]
MEIRGGNLAELFQNAALGLMDTLFSGCPIAREKNILLEIEELTVEELLVTWLREILYRYQTEGLALADLNVLEISQNKVTGNLVWGSPPENCLPEAEIKGVTYHGLSVQEHESGYLAHIVFDI